MKFKEFLKSKDLTISRLSRMCDLSRPTIYKLINGKLNLEDYTITIVAMNLGITKRELLKMIKEN